MPHKQVKVILIRRVFIDALIAKEISWLNLKGVETVASCQGPPPTAVIKPSSRDLAIDLGYNPRYCEDTDLWEILLHDGNL